MSTKESQRLKRLSYTSRGLTCEGKIRQNPNKPRPSSTTTRRVAAKPLQIVTL